MKTRSRVGKKLNSRYINRIDVYREGDAQVVVYPLPWFLTNNKGKELITGWGLFIRSSLAPRKNDSRTTENTRRYEANGLWSTVDNTHQPHVQLPLGGGSPISLYPCIYIDESPPDGFFTGRIRCNPWYF